MIFGEKIYVSKVTNPSILVILFIKKCILYLKKRNDFNKTNIVLFIKWIKSLVMIF